jgi:hypothetical protein
MNLQNVSDVFLYELWTLCTAIKQLIAELLRMSRLTSNYEIGDELKADADNSKEHWYRSSNDHVQLSADLGSGQLRCNEWFDRIK